MLEHVKEILVKQFKLKSDVALDRFLLDFGNIDTDQSNWVPYELYNPHEKTFTFTRLDVFHFGKRFFANGPDQIILKPKSHALFPHGYYRLNADEPVTFTKNLGDLKGTGNKLPSRPDRPKFLF